MVNDKHHYKNSMAGFTLVEIMVVVTVIGILVAFAYPNYQQYVIKTKRTAMMADLQNIGSQIQSQKLAKGNYANVDPTLYTNVDYPQQDNAKLYTVTGTLDSNQDKVLGDWVLTATPKSNAIVRNDGRLTLSADGLKCRMMDTSKLCGKANEWNE